MPVPVAGSALAAACPSTGDQAMCIPALPEPNPGDQLVRAGIGSEAGAAASSSTACGLDAGSSTDLLKNPWQRMTEF
jgi:hypothetical protein